MVKAPDRRQPLAPGSMFYPSWSATAMASVTCQAYPHVWITLQTKRTRVCTSPCEDCPRNYPGFPINHRRAYRFPRPISKRDTRFPLHLAVQPVQSLARLHPPPAGPSENLCGLDLTVVKPVIGKGAWASAEEHKGTPASGILTSLLFASPPSLRIVRHVPAGEGNPVTTKQVRYEEVSLGYPGGTEPAGSHPNLPITVGKLFVLVGPAAASRRPCACWPDASASTAERSAAVTPRSLTFQQRIEISRWCSRTMPFNPSSQ
jgi:hypothetical protein